MLYIEIILFMSVEMWENRRMNQWLILGLLLYSDFCKYNCLYKDSMKTVYPICEEEQIAGKNLSKISIQKHPRHPQHPKTSKTFSTSEKHPKININTWVGFWKQFVRGLHGYILWKNPVRFLGKNLNKSLKIPKKTLKILKKFQIPYALRRSYLPLEFSPRSNEECKSRKSRIKEQYVLKLFFNFLYKMQYREFKG